MSVQIMCSHHGKPLVVLVGTVGTTISQRAEPTTIVINAHDNCPLALDRQVCVLRRRKAAFRPFMPNRFLPKRSIEHKLSIAAKLL